MLDHAQVAALVALGRRTAEHFGEPQDMEWAYAAGEIYLLQSRPITTLFPSPEPLPAPEAGLRIYLNLQGMQGFLEPRTPAGISAFRSVAAGVQHLLHLKEAAGTSFLSVAAGRIYLDATGMLRLEAVRQAFAGETIDRARTPRPQRGPTPAGAGRGRAAARACAQGPHAQGGGARHAGHGESRARAARRRREPAASSGGSRRARGGLRQRRSASRTPVGHSRRLCRA